MTVNEIVSRIEWIPVSKFEMASYAGEAVFYIV